LLGFWIPFGNLIGAAIAMGLSSRRGDFVLQHAKASLNFQITMTVYAILCFILCIVFIGLLLLPLLAVFWVVSMVKACAQANQGEAARYAFSWQIVK
jgi:uncharacterized Tic20 family protein